MPAFLSLMIRRIIFFFYIFVVPLMMALNFELRFHFRKSRNFNVCQFRNCCVQSYLRKPHSIMPGASNFISSPADQSLYSHAYSGTPICLNAPVAKKTVSHTRWLCTSRIALSPEPLPSFPVICQSRVTVTQEATPWTPRKLEFFVGWAMFQTYPKNNANHDKFRL